LTLEYADRINQALTYINYGFLLIFLFDHD